VVVLDDCIFVDRYDFLTFDIVMNVMNFAHHDLDHGVNFSDRRSIDSSEGEEEGGDDGCDE
jgi:hypothetical protein